MHQHDRPILTDSQLTEMIHRAGVRPSVQRIAILSYISNSRRHPSADEIYNALSPRFPSLSLTTVYNSLHALSDARLIKELEIDSNNRRYDLAPQPEHSHFICRNCGRIFDMDMPSLMQSPQVSGFRIDTIDIYYKGVCPDCVSANIANNSDENT